MLNYAQLPKHLQASAQMWIEHGILPSGFLVSVLENNLKEAFMYADEESTLCMKDIVSFFYNEAPEHCWGSCDVIAKWFGHRGLSGIEPTGTVGAVSIVKLQLVKKE